MEKIILASSNQHKVEEIASILGEMGYAIETMKTAGLGDMEIIESGVTFEENALIKAMAVHSLLGGYALADDSGLEVDALNGAPGVYSARYSGEPKNDARNNQKLLEALKDTPYEKRTARFVTVLCMLMPEGERIEVRGTVEGIIGFEPKGVNGFGYDPLFVVPDIGKTFAELDANEKNKLSHRANALVKLKERLNGL